MLKSPIIMLSSLWFCRCCHIFVAVGSCLGFNSHAFIVATDIFQFILPSRFMFSIYHAFCRILFFLWLLLDWSSFLLEVICGCLAPLEVMFTFWKCTLAFKKCKSINTSLLFPNNSNLECCFFNYNYISFLLLLSII